MKTVEKRRMCPNCRAIISISDRVCPECGVQLGPRAVDLRASQFASSFMPRANLTSAIILIINIAFFLAELVISYNLTHSTDISPWAMVLLGAKEGPLIAAGQHWRLITAGFLHGGFMHIAMNSWALFVLVTEVEQFYGTSRLIVTYVFATFLGFLFSYLRSPALSLGASAACFGLFGIMLAMGLRERSNPLVQAVRAHYGQWVIFGLLMSFFPGIDMAAHIGGFVGGFLVGVLGGLPGIPNSPRETFWKALAAISVLVVFYCWFQDFRFYPVMMRSLSNQHVLTPQR